MERIRIVNLQPGHVTTQSLFSANGQKLIGAGVQLTPRQIDAMRRSGEIEVFQAHDVQELVEAGIVARMDTAHLAVGQKARERVLSSTGHVIIEAGEEVEEHHLDAVNAGGAYLAKKPAEQRRERILMADALVEDLEAQAATLSLRIAQEPNVDWIRPDDPVRWPDPQSLAAFRNEHVNRLRRFYALIEAGLTSEIDQFTPVVDDLLDHLARFPTRFTQLALLCPRREDYLPDHCYTTAVLGMAIGATLRWTRQDVHTVGLVGLLFDLGMLLVPERIRSGACSLTDIDRSRVQRHPIFSLSMMQVIRGVPPIVQLAALHHHERENGSGYPRGRRKDAICDFARVIAVADAYAATTEPRHYRVQKLPYIAMEEMIRSTSGMAFWKPAVRALLQAAGLFPVGSYVKLNSGKNAHVIASNPTQLDRPTIQPLTVDGDPDGPALDLAAIPKERLWVSRPIAHAKG